MAVLVHHPGGAAAARTVHQPHQRQAQVARHGFDAGELVADAAFVGAAADREVVARHHDIAAVDLAAPDHEACGREGFEVARFVVARFSRDAPDLDERARVEQLVDPLAYRELAAGMLPLDSLRPAHLLCESLALAQFVDLFFPAHAAL